MIIVPLKEGENIERALKKFKRKMAIQWLMAMRTILLWIVRLSQNHQYVTGPSGSKLPTSRVCNRQKNNFLPGLVFPGGKC